VESLKSLIECFKPTECQYIRGYYLRKNNGSATKRLQLFDVVKNNLATDNNSACHLLYNQEPDSSFCHLKARLKKDLLNFLILFPPSKSCKNLIEKMDLECRKSFIQAKILINRGELSEAHTILKQTLKLTKRYDIIDLQIAITDLLRSTFNIDKKQYSKYTKEASNNVQLQSTLIAAKTFDDTLHRDNNILHDETTSEQITKMELLYAATKSPNLGYWFFSSKMQFYRLQGNLKLSYLNGLRFSHLVETQPALDSTLNKIQAKNKLALILIQLQNRERAQKLLKEALSLSAPETEEWLMTLENLFRVRFINRDYKLSAEAINRVLKNKYLKREQKEWAKWTFYRSCLKFVLKDFKSSMFLLNQSDLVSKEKSMLCLEHRLVEMLNLIELEDYDLLDYKTENFRKLIEYHSHFSTARTRSIVKLFKSFIRNSYSFDKTWEEEQGIREKLSLRNSKSHTTPLIDINYWWEGKIEANLETV